MYITWPQAGVVVPKIQLVGFDRVNIAVAETKTVKFTISPEQMQVWIDEIGFQIMTGILNFTTMFNMQ